MWRAAWLCAIGCGFAHGHSTDGAAVGSGDDGSMQPDAMHDAMTDSSFDAPPLPPIMYQQGSGATTSSKTTTIAFPNAQLYRSLNVVFVCWINNDTLQSVADATGNTYMAASGPSQRNGMNFAVYYACGVAGTASNSVTVTFQNAPTQTNIRIAEYSGLAMTNCHDTGAVASGNAPAQSSGAVTPNAGAELLVAGNCTYGKTTLADPTYTSRGIDTFGNLVEDRIVSLAAPYAATATQDSQNDWIISLVTFFAR